MKRSEWTHAVDFLQVDNDLCGPAPNEFAWGGDHVIADLSKSTT